LLIQIGKLILEISKITTFTQFLDGKK